MISLVVPAYNEERYLPRLLDSVEAAAAAWRGAGGASGVRLDRWSPGLALTWAMFLPMVWATGFDTGVVFCRRERMGDLADRYWYRPRR